MQKTIEWLGTMDGVVGAHLKTVCMYIYIILQVSYLLFFTVRIYQILYIF